MSLNTLAHNQYSCLIRGSYFSTDDKQVKDHFILNMYHIVKAFEQFNFKYNSNFQGQSSEMLKHCDSGYLVINADRC